MADVKISALPASTTPLAGTEVLPIVQGTTTKQVAVTDLTAGRAVSGASFSPSSSTIPANGVYLPAANSLGLATNSGLAMYVSSSNNVGIRTGTATNINSLSVSAATAGQGIDLYYNGGASARWSIVNPGVNNTVYIGSVINNDFALWANSAERMRVFVSGGVSIGNTTDPGATNLSVTGTVKGGTTIGVGAATPSTSGAGITFPATQSASTDANTLDDYEEGTYTPVVTAGSGSITSYTASGAYTKVGNLVTLSVDVTITNNGTGATNINVTLPFTCASTSTYMFGVGQEIVQTGTRLYLQAVSINNTVVTITNISNTYPALTGARLVGSITYRSV